LASSTSNKVNEWLATSRRVFSEWLERNLSSTSKEVVGVTINADFLKLVKLNSNSNQYELEHFALKSLPTGLVSKNTLVNIPEIANILKSMVAEANLSTKNLAITLSRSSVIIKNITLDHRLTHNEIESRIWMEANRLFPDLITDIYLDFVITGPSTQDPDFNEIVIIACRKNQIQPYIELAEKANLKLKIIDINHYALERAIILINPQIVDVKIVGILGINYNSMHLTVFEGAKLIYSHELNYDGSNLKKAENLEPTSQLDYIHTHLGPNLQHIMQFFYTSKPKVWIDKIILIDDCAAQIPQLAQYVTRETSKKVLLADPFTQMKIGPNVNKSELDKVAPSLLLCCGVAMSEPL
jgi:type IV pilus assembly protein PilM